MFTNILVSGHYFDDGQKQLEWEKDSTLKQCGVKEKFKIEMRTSSMDSQPSEDVLNHPSPSMLSLEVLPPNLHADRIIEPLCKPCIAFLTLCHIYSLQKTYKLHATFTTSSTILLLKSPSSHNSPHLLKLFQPKTLCLTKNPRFHGI